MIRRRYLRALGGCFGAMSLAGCAGVLPGSNQGPEYPGGTLVVENTGSRSVTVSVTTKLEQYNASLNIAVPGGETVVRREFVTATQGDIVTLEVQLGETGERLRFQFLPAGSKDNSPPEVAQLSFENDVEASASWTATSGK